MKRLLIAMLLVVLPGVAFAFDTTPVTRVGVLRGTDVVHVRVADALRSELRARGIDAFDAVRTYEEAVRDGAAVADYYVEIIGGRASTAEHGGIGIGTEHSGMSIGLLVSRMAAEVRIYDGETMELIRSHDFSKRSRAVVPTSVGVGGGSFFAYIAMPYIERAQFRRIIRAAGRAAAELVIDTVR